MLDRKIFFDRVRSEPFGGFLSGSQVSGISAVLDVWSKSNFTDPRWLAYCLATSFHESGKAMVGVREYGQGKGQPYGAPVPPYNLCYYGRGMCQITWAKNYEAASDKLKPHGFAVDLLRNPDDALKDDVSAAILLYGSAEGWFTGRKLATYFTDKIDDPTGARHVINGSDKAALIATYHGQFLAAIKASDAPSIVHVDADKPVLASIETAINAAAVKQGAVAGVAVPKVASPGPLVIPPIKAGPDPAIKMPAASIPVAAWWQFWKRNNA